MSFEKRTYVGGETPITAANLNAIQDELIRLDDEKYGVPPDTGIPKADLSQEVQTALEKAGTALQPGDVDTALDGDSTNPVQNKAIYGKMTSTAQADAIYHLGFYIDENGDLCQVD